MGQNLVKTFTWSHFCVARDHLQSIDFIAEYAQVYHELNKADTHHSVSVVLNCFLSVAQAFLR